MLPLVFAHRNAVRLVQEDVGSLEDGVGEQADARVVRALLLCLVLELRHPAGLAHTGDAVQHPGELGVFGNLRLDKEGAFLHVHSPGDVLGSGDAGAVRKLCGVLRDRDGVEVRNEEDGVVLILHPDPVDQRAQVVAEVQRIGRSCMPERTRCLAPVAGWAGFAGLPAGRTAASVSAVVMG